MPNALLTSRVPLHVTLKPSLASMLLCTVAGVPVHIMRRGLPDECVGDSCQPVSGLQNVRAAGVYRVVGGLSRTARCADRLDGLGFTGVH
jgi:hypothetical protein